MTINFYLNQDQKRKNPELAIYCYVRGISPKKTITLKKFLMLVFDLKLFTNIYH